MEAIASVAAVLSLASTVVSLLANVGYGYRQARFGILGHVLHITGIIDTRALERLHVQINAWTDEQALAWKASQLSTYNAIAVASAIFASVGITTWQLGDITSVHWIVRALTGASTVLGVLSIATATHQYQKINQLDSALSVRLWLSTGPTHASLLPKSLQAFLLNMGVRPDATAIPRANKYENLDFFKDFPLESSVISLKMVALPGYLLYLAVLFFLVGFLLYPMLLWLENIDETGYSYRNIFIFFITVTGLFLAYWIALFVGRSVNDASRDSFYELGSLAGPLGRTAELEQLKSRLEYS